MITRSIFTFLAKHIPFTYAWLVRRMAGEPRTVLDIGCGTGHFMSLVKKNSWQITGIDIHKKTAEEARTSGIYKEVLVGDLVEVCKGLVKDRKKYDLVFCSQVIEHISRNDGTELLNLMDKLYKKKIYVGTPRGYMVQPGEFLGDNIYQRHKSGWSELDFTSRGYKVYGVGFSLVWAEKGLARSTNGLMRFVLVLISFLFSPLSLFVPSMASGIMAIKSSNNE